MKENQKTQLTHLMKKQIRKMILRFENLTKTESFLSILRQSKI